MFCPLKIKSNRTKSSRGKARYWLPLLHHRKHYWQNLNTRNVMEFLLNTRPIARRSGGNQSAEQPCRSYPLHRRWIVAVTLIARYEDTLPTAIVVSASTHPAVTSYVTISFICFSNGVFIENFNGIYLISFFDWEDFKMIISMTSPYLNMFMAFFYRMYSMLPFVKPILTMPQLCASTEVYSIFV